MIALYAFLVVAFFIGFALHALLSIHKCRKDCAEAYTAGRIAQAKDADEEVMVRELAAFRSGLVWKHLSIETVTSN